MDVTYFSNEFPKEDLATLLRHLQNHSKRSEHPLLAEFLSEASLAVKDEVRKLPVELRWELPPLENFLSWAEQPSLREGPLCGAVDGALLIVVQLAIYIGYMESTHSPRDGTVKQILAGLGVGLLSTTAVALSSNLTNVPRAGADSVRIAFRMGIHVVGVSENLETRDLNEKPDTWAYVVHNVDPAAAQKELDNLQPCHEALPDTSKIFISAVSRTSVTVSGPPTRLKALFTTQSEFFRDAKNIPLPVYGGLCHAPHVYGPKDTHAIIDTTLSTVQTGAKVVLPVYSTSTGQPYPATKSAELYEDIVSELLTQAICWDRVIDGIVERAKGSEAAESALLCFNNSIPLNDLHTALKTNVSKTKARVSDLTSWVTKDIPTTNSSGSSQSTLAIVGMSCRLPGGATDTEKFWQILEQGLDVSREIPADRFDISTHYDPSGKELNKSATQYGCFIEEPGLFDAGFFNMSPKEAQTVDPQMRLALVTAYEALEQSGYVANRTSSTRLDRVGTFYGQAADDYREVNQGQEVSTYYIPGGCRAFGPGRINYFFKFAGPSYSVDTACSSGLSAVEVACQALWAGVVDTAVTGGVNVLTNPDGFSGLCNGHFLTKGHNACKTWDAGADGYCRADGVVSFVIKRLEDAEADNDTVLATVLGAGTNHSAQAVSITHPHAGHQADLSRKVLRQAGVNPLDVSYIELHGTGTQAGDHEEMQGIHEVYAPLTGKKRNKTQPLHIGSVKANVGHGESVAGATSLLKVVLMLHKNMIPPHVGIKTEINPRLDFESFEKRNLHIDFEPAQWPHVPGKQRLAVVNSFGAAGGNTTLILQEPAPRLVEQADPRKTHILAISGKTKNSLAQNIKSLSTYLKNNPHTAIADLGYTSTARRYHHSHRIAFAASDVSGAQKQLAAHVDKVDSIKAISKSGSPPIGFAFTGQGASHKSMSLELYRDSPVFRLAIQHLDNLAQGQGFPSFLPALDGSHDKEHAHAPVITQLALACSEMALAKYWASLGIEPDLVIGHSLGEYAALQVAGVLSASDAVFMVGRRAVLLQDRCEIGSHIMMAVRGSVADIQAKAEDHPYTIACINGPAATVLSGTKEQMDKVAVPLDKAGLKTTKLDVAFAFHSDQTDPILDDYENILATGVVFQEPKLPVISPLLGKVVFDGKTLNANYFRRSTRETVDFLSALKDAEEISTVSEETVWIEVGPHPTCTSFIKNCLPATNLAVPSFRRGEDNWKTLAESLASLHLVGINVDWDEFHLPFKSTLQVLSNYPSYSFSEKNHWLPYTGSWCLTKGNEFYDADTSFTQGAIPASISDLQTSTVQSIIEESFDSKAGSGTVVMRSDLMQRDFLAAANGHRMNDCGVVTSSIHADIAYTLGGYLHNHVAPKSKGLPPMDMTNLVVTKGLVAHRDKKVPQIIQVTATTPKWTSGVDLQWHNVDNEGHVAEETFATARIVYGDSDGWMSSWKPMTHLIQNRIQSLSALADEGKASRFSHKMAYTLFAANLVDYAEKYRGMQSAVIHDLEGFADITLTTKEDGSWTVPPYFIDSVAHLAGFIMNCSDAMDTAKNFCVTPGWKSMRFAKPLGPPGARYKSYVKMIPTTDDPSIYLGDVYIMQGDDIIGFVGGIKFCKYPRILIDRFFSPSDNTTTAGGIQKSRVSTKIEQNAKPMKGPQTSPNGSDDAAPLNVSPVSRPSTAKDDASNKPGKASPSKAEPDSKTTGSRDDKALSRTDSVDTDSTSDSEGPTTPPSESVSSPVTDGTTAKALQLIADECGCDRAELGDDVSFEDVGVDSLMSLVISEKLGSELDVKVSGSLFLDYPTIGDLRSWLDEYQ